MSNTTTTRQKATYNPQAKKKFATSHRKEGKCFFSSFGIITTEEPWVNSEGIKEAREAISLRLYGTGAKNYACLWVTSPSIQHTSGSGSAGGCGYHRPSQAAQEAINNAGFSLSVNIGGCGDDAIKSALWAIAEEIGLKDFFLVNSHA